MRVKLPTEHHLEFLSLKGGCTGSSKSTFVKMPHCWKSGVMAIITSTILFFVLFDSLRPLNSLSVMRDGSSWVEPVLS